MQLGQKQKKTLDCFKGSLIANGGELPIVFEYENFPYYGLLRTEGGRVYIEHDGRLFFTISEFTKFITGLSNSGWKNCRIGQDDVPEAEWPTFNEWYAGYARVHPSIARPCKKRRRTAWRDDDKAAGVVALFTPDQEEEWINERLADIEHEPKRKQ